MRFGCIGDIHLGQGVERYGPERLQDQLDVLNRACELFCREGVDGVLIPGDIFEGPLPTPEQYVGVARALKMLDGIPVVACLGNGRHDAAMRERNALEVLSSYAPDAITVHSHPGVSYIGDVAICALPWTALSRLIASRNGGDRDALHREAAALLLQAVRGLREDAGDGPAVLLLHWSLSGAVTPTGREVGPDFGVVLDTGEIEAAGFDAVIAGHIHQPQVYLDDAVTPSVILRTDPGVPPMTNAWGWYVGSPLPLNFGEARCTHGVWIAEVGAATKAQFVPIESRPFVTIDAESLGDDVSDPLLYFPYDEAKLGGAIVRLRYRATQEQRRRFDDADLRRAFLDLGAHRVSIEPEIVRKDRARVKVETDSLSELDALQLWLDEHEVNGDRGAAMRDRTQAYLEAGA